jgi:hypothetical protein
MMEGNWVLSLVTGLASGIISSALTYVSTRSKIRLDMTVEYDKALHAKRLELYKELWPKTKRLSRFDWHFALTYNVVKSVAADTREWYFGEGGIYLSRHSREPYFHLKSLLQKVLDNQKWEAAPDAPIDDREICEEIVSAAHDVRTSLADDIGARRASWL